MGTSLSCEQRTEPQICIRKILNLGIFPDRISDNEGVVMVLGDGSSDGGGWW